MTVVKVRGTRVVHWNIRRGTLPRPFRSVGPRVNNFGDLIGPELVSRVVDMRGLTPARPHRTGRRLLAVGSIMHMARSGDVIWGTGVNGKVDDAEHNFRGLDVRAVRGPETALWLADRGIDVPQVYGDPGLLVPRFFPELAIASREKTAGVTIVPNYHDYSALAGDPRVIAPRGNLLETLEKIARSEAVVGSSLHGIVIADALGIPAVLMRPGAEPMFKYTDYYRGIGRPEFPVADDVEDAIDILKAVRNQTSLADYDPAPLLAAFPTDLWSAS